MDDTKGKAEYFRIGLMLGVHTVSEVVEWADSVLLRQDNPPYIFVELSLIDHSDPKHVCAKLTEFPGNVDKSKVLHEILPMLLGRMYLLLSQHHDHGPTLANKLYQLYIDLQQTFGPSGLPKDLYPMFALDDQYSLARHGTYGTEQGVLQDFLTFLKPYTGEGHDSP